MKSKSLFLFVLLSACGSSPTPVVTDAAVDAFRDVATEAIADVPTTKDVAVCDVGAPPVAISMLPMIRGRTVILGGDAGTAPTPSGGDPSGRWLVTATTLYLPASTRGQVVEAATAVVGTGWIVVEGNSYRIETLLDLRLESTAAGTIRRPVGNSARGTFVQEEGTLILEPDCGVNQSGMMVNMRSLGFSRDSSDRGRMFVTVTGIVTSLVVLDLERAP
jgi:hypothetical protein